MADGKLSWKVQEDGKLTNLLGTRPAAAIAHKDGDIGAAGKKIGPTAVL